jgi:mannose-6-phosphate isomerase-like protein (cupin superfamily)
MTGEDALELPTLGMRIVFHQRAAATGGELLEYDVIGRPRGFPVQAHVHPRQSEHHETISGSLLVKLDGVTRVLGPGESIEIPPGKAHRHYAAGEVDGHVRVTLRPALRTEQLLERLAELDAAGAVTKKGYLKPLTAARLILDFPDEGRAAQPPAAVQRAFARTVSWAADSRGEYAFVDEWDVAAPPEAVFDLIADARTYPSWWRPVYIDVESEGEPGLGAVSAQHFKGRLPYHLRTRSTITVYNRPRSIGADVVGDLRGRGLWTLTPTDAGTHVRFDWSVFADKPLVRALTPVLRPAFRWNHAWAIARAQEGLEPAARARG